MLDLGTTLGVIDHCIQTGRARDLGYIRKPCSVGGSCCPHFHKFHLRFYLQGEQRQSELVDVSGGPAPVPFLPGWLSVVF